MAILDDNVQAYFTENSVYLIDLDGKRYYRSPRSDEGRSGFEIAMMTKNLEDDKWLDLDPDIDNPVTIVKYADGTNVLNIRYKGSVVGILTSPLIGESICG